MAWLIDNSVWQRITRPGVLDTIEALTDIQPIVTATPQMLEFCHSARTAAEYDRSMDALSAFQLLTADDDCHRLAAEIQRSLWHGGRVRGAGAFDILIAATAWRHGATVVHYDRNFATIAEVIDGFEHRWIAAPGTLA